MVEEHIFKLRMFLSIVRLILIKSNLESIEIASLNVSHEQFYLKHQ